MKSNMTISVEFLVGTNIENAILEASMKAREWNVAYVTFNFNGTGFSIGQSDKALENAMYEWDNGETRFIVAS